MKIGKGLSLSSAEGIGLIALVVVGGYLLYKAIKGLPAAATSAVQNAPAAAINAAGNGVGNALDAIGTQVFGSAYNSIPSTWSGVWSALTGGSTANATAAATQGANRDQVVTPNYLGDISGAVGGSSDTSTGLDSSYNFGLDTTDAAGNGSGGLWY